MGNYTNAEPLYKEALGMYRRLFKDDNDDLAASINNMAEFYNVRGRFSDAEPLFKEALEMSRRVFKGDHPDLEISINNMAMFYNERGRYTEAESLFKEALEMNRRLFKGDHPNLARSISNIANFYGSSGRYSKAEPLHKEAFGMRRRMFKGDHPDLVVSINNMAIFYNNRGNYIRAEPLFKESLEMDRHLYEGDHIHLAGSINNMATFYIAKFNYTQAELLYKEALEMNRRLFKGDHPGLATGIGNMALFYNDMGRYTEAESLFKETLEMSRRLFKGNHIDQAHCIINMASFFNDIGRYSKAELLYKEMIVVYKAVLTNYFPSLSEKEKGEFWNTMKESFERFNSFAVKREQDNPLILSSMFENQLFTKGLLLSSTMKVKNSILNSGDATLVEMFNDWQSQRNVISKYYRLTNEQLTEKRINLDSLEKAANDLEKQLSLKSETFKNEYDKKQYTYSDVQKALNENEAAIEIVRFRNYDKRWTDTLYYAALICTKESEYPQLVLLENGNDLEGKYMNRYKDSIMQRIKDYDSYKQYWKPIAEILSGMNIKKVYISPDGVYHQINLATLFNPETEKYLLDEMDIQIVGSTRDIVDKKEAKSFANTAVLIGNPKFNLDKDQYQLYASNVRTEIAVPIPINFSDNIERSLDSAISRDGISALPSTRQEINKIYEILSKKRL